MADDSNKRSVLGIVAAAVVAGLIVGAVAVYVTNRPSGNDQQAASGAASCTAALQRSAAIDKAATGAVAAMLAATEATSLDGLAFKAPGGADLSLADFSGKTVLLNLWATWCAPCREEMPALDALQKQKGGDDFEVVAVNIDRGAEDKPKKFLTDIKVESLAFYRDDTMGIFNDLKRRALAVGLPVTILIDEKGCMLANMNGPADWASDDAIRLIDVALKGG